MSGCSLGTLGSSLGPWKVLGPFVFPGRCGQVVVEALFAWSGPWLTFYHMSGMLRFSGKSGLLLGIRPSLQHVADFGQRRTYMFYRKSVK